jgi:hypothetical protein
MKKSELKQIIKEEIQKSLNEGPNIDIINRSLNLLDKAADMAAKNPQGNVVELAKIIKKYTQEIRQSL